MKPAKPPKASSPTPLETLTVKESLAVSTF